MYRKNDFQEVGYQNLVKCLAGQMLSGITESLYINSKIVPAYHWCQASRLNSMHIQVLRYTERSPAMTTRKKICTRVATDGQPAVVFLHAF